MPYDRQFKREHLQQPTPTVKLVTYSCAPIPMFGCLPVTVSWNEHYVPYCALHCGTALLVMDLINGLCLCFKGSTIQPAAKMNFAYVMSTAPLSRNALGCAKGFMRKVKLSENVPPVRQKRPRRLSIFFRKS